MILDIKFSIAIISLLSFTHAVAKNPKTISISQEINIPINGKIEMMVNDKITSVYTSPGMPNSLYITKEFASYMYGNLANIFLELNDKKRVLVIQRIEFNEINTRGVKIAKLLENSKFIKLKFINHNVDWYVTWLEREAYTYANTDAIAGPHAIPFDIVKYNINTPQQGEIRFTLPMANTYHWWIAGTQQKVDGVKIFFSFAPQFETSVAGASAAAHISKIHGGRFVGHTKPVKIAFGVERPTRQVNFATPLYIGPINLSSVLARTEDYGSAKTIAGYDKSLLIPDEDSIIVTAKRKIPYAINVVYIGTDALSSCSSITYDKPAKLIYLSCIKPIR